MIMKQCLIPIQDDHENGINGVGVLRLDVRMQNSERLTREQIHDFLEAPKESTLQAKQKGGIRLGGASAGGPGVINHG
jgi:hypothetical protein